jgi:hypothetical protein
MASRIDEMRRLAAIGLAALAAIAVAVLHGAETSDGMPDFSGTWTLDREISTNPAQIDFAPGTTAPARPRVGFGGRGFGRGGGTRQRADDNSADSLTDVEKARLKALTDQLKTGSATLVISHHDPDFVVNDAQNHTLFLHTTGVNEENHLGEITISSSTHWDGSRLVSECVLGSRLTLIYTYTLVPNTRQLVVRVARQAGDRRPAGQDVRLVYRPQK